MERNEDRTGNLKRRCTLTNTTAPSLLCIQYKNYNLFYSQDPSDKYGTLIADSDAGSFMTSLQNPSSIKVWIREGGRYETII